MGFILSAVGAQDIIVSTPSPWMTLRSDSIMLTVQADTSKLPRNKITFRVQRHTRSRISTLFSKTVKMDDISGEFFLGRVKREPLGGSDLISVKWNVPGTELEGVLGPLGIVSLNEKKDEGLAKAVRLKEGISEEQVKEALSGKKEFELAGAECAFGWNKEALFVAVAKGKGVSEVQFAFDGKCGKNAFLSWADRFVVYNAESDSVYGVHYKRTFDEKTIKYADMGWGEGLSALKADSVKVIKISWSDIGVIPFEERNVGFSAYAGKGSGKLTVSYPGSAQREIPGTWGDIRLEK
ncbi:MAG: hypothetical protein ACLFVQ_14745 [Chitinispirillaceae bacterium]